MRCFQKMRVQFRQPLNGGFPKLWVPFWGPIIRNIIVGGLYWGPLILGNYQAGSTSPGLVPHVGVVEHGGAVSFCITPWI